MTDSAREDAVVQAKRDEHAARAFGNRLAAALQERGMNYSDLARLVFGEDINAQGYPVARNRQSIGRYVSGQQMPDRQTRERIAAALHMPYGALFPDEGPVNRPGSGVVLTQVDKQRSRLTLDVTLPTDIALDIIRMISPHT